MQKSPLVLGLLKEQVHVVGVIIHRYGYNLEPVLMLFVYFFEQRKILQTSVAGCGAEIKVDIFPLELVKRYEFSFRVIKFEGCRNKTG